MYKFGNEVVFIVFLFGILATRCELIGFAGLEERDRYCIINGDSESQKLLELAMNDVQKSFPEFKQKNISKILQIECQDLWLRERVSAKNFKHTRAIGRNYYLKMILSPTQKDTEYSEATYARHDTNHSVTIYRGYNGRIIVQNTFTPVLERKYSILDGVVENSELFPSHTPHFGSAIETENKDQIKEENPDIIGFQEVRFRFEAQAGRDQHRISHQIQDLSHRLTKYQYVFRPGDFFVRKIGSLEAMTYLEATGYSYSHVDEGVAIFSKFPIVETDFIVLTRNFDDREDEHQRTCLRALINTTNGIPINVFVSHMSLSEEARRRNVLEVWQFLQRNSQPQVYLGDFNEVPNSQMVNFLIGKSEIDGKTGNFKDAWLELYPDDPPKGWTFTTLSEEPKRRIDFILYRGEHLQLKKMQVLDVPEGDVKPSDHRALYSIFEVNRG